MDSPIRDGSFVYKPGERLSIVDGAYVHLPRKYYDEIRGVVSKSLVLEPLRSGSPAEAWWKYENGNGDKAPTPAMLFGTRFHTCLLEPDVWATSFDVLEIDEATFGNSRTKAHREEKARRIAKAEKEGVELIDAEEKARIEKMTDAVCSIPEIASLVRHEGAIAEVSALGEVLGCGSKCRADLLVPTGPETWELVDVKTAADAAPEPFARACYQYGYHIQAAFYREIFRNVGVKIDRVSFVVVETGAEWDLLPLDVCAKTMVARYVPTDAFLETGWVETMMLLREWIAATEKQSFAGLPTAGQLDLPRWTDAAIEDRYAGRGQ